jgi:hypothetical protein
MTLLVEVLHEAMLCSQLGKLQGFTGEEYTQIVLVGLRIGIWALMTLTYLHPMYTWSAVEQDVETEPLLAQNSSGRPRDAQHGGWIDYVVGFSTLFPYLWSVSTPCSSRICC